MTTHAVLNSSRSDKVINAVLRMQREAGVREPTMNLEIARQVTEEVPLPSPWERDSGRGLVDAEPTTEILDSIDEWLTSKTCATRKSPPALPPPMTNVSDEESVTSPRLLKGHGCAASSLDDLLRGSITDSNWVRVAKPITLLERLRKSFDGQLSRVMSTFARYDTDGSKSLDRDVFRCLVREAIGWKGSAAIGDCEIDRLFVQLDDDNSGTISFPELLRTISVPSAARRLSREAPW